MDNETQKAVWSTAYINNLPDAAFAWIEPGGKKDSEGKTVPRTLRHLPHHGPGVKLGTENSSVDLIHLRAARARVNQIPEAGRSKASAHLEAHAKALLGGRSIESAVVRRDFTFEIKTINREERSLRMVASTNALDSYGDVVEQHWDLSHYRANPVVLYWHNRKATTLAETLPLGVSRSTEVVNGQLEYEPQFTDDRVNPEVERIWQGVLQGVIRTSSVGFTPGEIEKKFDEATQKTIYHVGTPERPNVLKEISIAPMPANHQAVALSGDEGADAPSIADIYEAREAWFQEQARSLERSANPQQELPGIGAGETMPPPAAKGVRMDPEKLIQELNSKLEARSAELATATGRADTAESALETEKAALASEREAHATTKALLDEANKQIAKAEAERKAAEEASIRKEVEAFSGVKFLPSEVDDEIESRTRKGSDAWQAKMAARPNLGLTSQVVPDDKAAKNSAARGRRVASALMTAANNAAEQGAR
jgi:hypothetical protein